MMLGGHALRGLAPGRLLLEPQALEHPVEVEGDPLRVPGGGVLEHEGANGRDRVGFGLAKPLGLPRQAGGLADALAVDVNERAAGVEENRPNALHASSARTTASSRLAIASTSAASGPSTRIRRSGSVPE